MTGFEPATAGPEVQRAIQLRHMVIFYLINKVDWIVPCG